MSSSDDKILVVTKSGEFCLQFRSSNHFPTDILRVEKFDENKVWSAAL